MKLFDKISNGYKKIASGIAIVAFLAIMYLAMMPLGTHLASAGVFTSQSGEGICGAKVKIVEWQNLWNTTTSCEPSTLGNFTLSGISYDGTTGSTYTVRAIKEGYGPDSKKVTLNTTNPDVTVNFDLSLSDPLYMAFLYDKPTSSGYESSIQIFNPYDFNITVDNSAIKNGVSNSTDYEIAPKKLTSIYLSQIWGSEVLGSADSETTRPAKVQGIIKTISTGIYSIAPSANKSSDTSFYFPFVYDKPVSAGYESGVQIFNPDTVNTIYANVSVIKSGVVLFNNFSIAPQTMGSRNARDVWGSEVLGSMKVETTGPAVAQGYIRTTSSRTYSIAPATKLPTVSTIYLPYLKTIGSSYDSGIQIFNPYDTATINATITSYNMLNGVMNTTSFDIAPNSFGSRTALQVAGGDFEGAFVIETKVDTTPTPALVQGYIRTSGTYTVAPAVQ